MSFNSYEFVFVFLPVSVAGFWYLRDRTGESAAILWLVLASLVFYVMADARGIIAVLPMLVATYALARLILSPAPALHRLKGAVLAVGVVLNVGFLCYFKYKNFLFEDTQDQQLSIVLPLGISFLTFQNIAFLADVASGQIRSLKASEYVLFLLFFPKVVAGPIAHYNDVIPQFRSARGLNSEHLIVGIFLFSIGLFKKTVIADQLVPLVDAEFNRPPWLSERPHTFISAWVGALAYTFQLYFDFSGYSDMALGVARMLGIKLPVNFNSPLRSGSIVEFWNRWHISLTSFLTDYIYTPLLIRITRFRVRHGMSVLRGRYSPVAAVFSQIAVPTMATMLISGIWHGVGWQFVIWGALHGLYLTINQVWKLVRPKSWPDGAGYEHVMRPVGVALTFGAVVIGLVFFRAPSVDVALGVLAGMAGLNGVLPYDLQLLRGLGFPLSWADVQVWQPLTPVICVVALTFVVLVLPNSLELVKRYEPALGFSSEESPYPLLEKAASGRLKSSSRSNAVMMSVSERLAMVVRNGLMIGRMLGIVIALLFAFGLAAVTEQSGFIYGQF